MSGDVWPTFQIETETSNIHCVNSPGNDVLDLVQMGTLGSNDTKCSSLRCCRSWSNPRTANARKCHKGTDIETRHPAGAFSKRVPTGRF